MYYVSVFKNQNGGKSYLEYSEDEPKERLKLHNLGEIKETENRAPLELVYYEVYKAKEEAIHRYDSLKLYGNAWAQLKRRIKKSLE